MTLKHVQSPPRNICCSVVNTMGTHSSGACDPSLILSPRRRKSEPPMCHLTPACSFAMLSISRAPDSCCHHLALLKRPDREERPSRPSVLPHCSLSRAARAFLSLWFHSPFITAHALHAPICHFWKIKKSLFTHRGQKWTAPNRICLQTKSLSQGQPQSHR